MSAFRRRPVLVDAVQWTGENEAEIVALVGDRFHAVDAEDRGDDPAGTGDLLDSAYNCWRPVYNGAWVLRHQDGSVERMSDAEFSKAYDPATNLDDEASDPRRSGMIRP